MAPINNWRGLAAAGLAVGLLVLGLAGRSLVPGVSRSAAPAVVASVLALVSPPASGRPARTPAAPIHLNTATTRQLRELPGVGELMAQRIIDARPFHSAGELKRVKGMTPEHYEAIRRLVEP